jgi:PKD repeat protein
MLRYTWLLLGIAIVGTLVGCGGGGSSSLPTQSTLVAALSVTPPIGDTTTTFTADASGSHDSSETPATLEYSWDWDNSGTFTTPSTVATATHTYATPGTYTIAVKVSTADGRSATTSKTVKVQPVGPAVALFSANTYTPGVSMTVSITVNPAPTVNAYAVEDMPPTGWTVSQISHDGAFDTATGKVKWGLFADATPRTLTYTVTPSSSSTGAQTFTGAVSFDGTSQAIIGDRTISR